MDKLIELFEKVEHLNSEEVNLIKSKWNQSLSLKRNENLIELGKIDKRIYFVKSGTLRIFFPKEDQEICVGFAYENTLICDFPSIVKGTPSSYYIQALKKCELVSISHSDFKLILSKSKALELCWQKMIEEALLGKIERETEMLTYAPQERVDRLNKRSPHIFQIIPKKYIASYLGMTPETLSRIYKY